ncbi:MAG: D-alanyl-D-alanine carboxypeptidase family protein [Bacillota bacterium]
MNRLATKILILILIISAMITSFPVITLAQPEEPKLTAEAAVLMDARTGRVLWSNNKDVQLAPASTTKILTALISIEKGKLTDQVTTSDGATRVEGTKVYLQPGEKQTLEDLLYAMLLNSANDAAMAIAEHIGGNVEEFTRMMNEKARALGAVHSNFANPHGLTDSKHYTTAYDLALIARAAMKNETFRKIVATRDREWRPGDPKTQLVRLYNINKLLYRYSGITGVKPGYTSEAGQCLVASASREGQEFISVVLNSSGAAVWSDATELLDYGFDNYRSLELVGNSHAITKVDVEGVPLEIKTAGEFRFLMDKNLPIVPKQEVLLLPFKPPVKLGQPVGELIFTLEGKQIGRVSLVAGNNIPKKFSLMQLWLRFTYLFFGMIVLILLVRLLKRRQRKFGFASSHAQRYERLRRYE